MPSDRRPVTNWGDVSEPSRHLSVQTGDSDHDGEESAPEASATINAQTIQNGTVVVERIETNVDVEVTLERITSGDVSNPVELDAGVHENVELSLTETFSEPTRLRLDIDVRETNQEILTARVTVYPSGYGEIKPGVDVTEVPANPDAGFNYPYFLYAPGGPADRRGGSVLVETNNTGRPTDDYQRHKEAAARAVRESSGRLISDRLFVPFVVPAFPRPNTDPVSFTHDVHQLDTETMRTEEGPLARVDLQLLAMVEDARGRLREQDYPVEEGLLLNGFSASGNFTHRFTILHPEKVRSITAGGVNGMPTLPIEQAEGHTLNYQIGVADIEELTGEPFDPEAYAEVDQFLYMGGLDGSDTIPFDDSWSDDQREIALDVYGQNMQRERFPYSKSVYEETGIEGTVFRIYRRIGHTPWPVVDDLVEFHRRALNGGDTAAMGGHVGDPEPPEAAFRYSPQSPSAGEQVSFDATESRAPGGDLVVTVWEFGDGATGSGSTPTHAFAESGAYDVEVRVVDSNGAAATATETVSISGAE